MRKRELKGCVARLRLLADIPGKETHCSHWPRRLSCRLFATGHNNRRVRGGEHASTFVLFPVCVLIVLFLAAGTIDASMAFLAAREVNNAANAAANDAAGVLGRNQFLQNGDYVIDQNRELQ